MWREGGGRKPKDSGVLSGGRAPVGVILLVILLNSKASIHALPSGLSHSVLGTKRSGELEAFALALGAPTRRCYSSARQVAQGWLLLGSQGPSSGALRPASSGMPTATWLSASPPANFLGQLAPPDERGALSSTSPAGTGEAGTPPGLPRGSRPRPRRVGASPDLSLAFPTPIWGPPESPEILKEIGATARVSKLPALRQDSSFLKMRGKDDPSAGPDLVIGHPRPTPLGSEGPRDPRARGEEPQAPAPVRLPGKLPLQRGPRPRRGARRQGGPTPKE